MQLKTALVALQREQRRVRNRGGSGLALPHLETTSVLAVKQMQNSKTWFLFTCSLISDFFLSRALLVVRRMELGHG